MTKVVYVGTLLQGATSLHRLNALTHLGFDVTAISQRKSRGLRRDLPGLANRALLKAYRSGAGFVPTLDVEGTNREVLEKVAAVKPAVLWLDKALTLQPATFAAVRRACPGIVIAGYSPDDMGGRHNRSSAFDRTIGLYDIFFTTKTYNVPEIEAQGCPNVRFVGNAYDPETHRPMDLTPQQREQYGGTVGFVGSYEADRGEILAVLAAEGIPVRIWGNAWPAEFTRMDGLTVEGRAVYGDEYCIALNAFDINLAFLRKRNRDLQTTRSIEIPACGAFMLAERTDEHLALFEEGKEAEFFGGKDELLEKVRYYIAHDDARRAIARAGRERCIRSGYSNLERMRQMISEIEGLTGERLL